MRTDEKCSIVSFLYAIRHDQENGQTENETRDESSAKAVFSHAIHLLQKIQIESISGIVTIKKS